MPVVNRRAFFATCAAGSSAVVVPSAVTAQAVGPQVAPNGPGGASPTPEQRLRTVLNGAAMTQLAYVATRYGVADQLAGGPESVDELHAAAGVHADSLYRCLRCLAGFGIFVEEPGRSGRCATA